MQKKLRSQARASILSVASGFISKAATFIFTPIFTRLLSPEEYGIYSLYVGLMGVLSVIVTFEITGSVIYRGLAKFDRSRSDEFISSALGTLGILSLSFLAIYILFKEKINAITSLGTHLTLLLLFQIFMNSAEGLYFAKKRYEGDFKTVALINILSGILSPILAVVLILSGLGGESRMIAPAAVSCVIVFPIILGIIRNGRKLYSKDAWKFIFGISAPMIPHYLSLSVIAQSDKIIVARTIGESAVGKYSVAYSAGFILSLLTNGILLALSPWLIRKLKGMEFVSVKFTLSLCLKLVCFSALLFLLLMPEVYKFIVSEAYYEALPTAYIITVSVVFAFLTSILTTCLVYYEKAALITKNSLFSAIFCMILTFVTARLFGYIGGAYATLASYALLFILNYKTLRAISDREILNAVSCFKYLSFLLIFALLIFLIRFSVAARIIMMAALVMIILPELRSYKKLLL